MKKLIIALIFAVSAAVCFGQEETEVYIPNYGIELDDEVTRIVIGSDTLNQNKAIKFLYEFHEKRLIFTYIARHYDEDSVLRVNTKKYEVPLDKFVNGKYVYEWVPEIFEVDTVKAKLLAEKLLIFKMNK